MLLTRSPHPGRFYDLVNCDSQVHIEIWNKHSLKMIIKKYLETEALFTGQQMA